MAHAHQKRLARLRELLQGVPASALLITHLPNVFYLSGFSGDAGALLVEPSKATLFTDGRFTIQAREEVGVARINARINIVRAPLPAAIGGYLQEQKRQIVCAFEDDRVTVSQFASLRKHSGKAVRWKGARGIVESLRAVKDEQEIQFMRDAAILGSSVMTEVIALVRPGMTESHLAAEIDLRLRRGGASGSSFETIVASGPRTAWPHARPTGKLLGKNELVVLDLGAILRGYSSDLTRTVYLGRAPQEIRRWYAAVVAAQSAARGAIRAGVTTGEVDAAARGTLARAGLGRFFVHSTGHGLGLEVHEGPRLARGQKDVLEAGNVVTVEPGVYVPGRGGIRVEDDVLVLENGSETLTTAARELVEIPV